MRLTEVVVAALIPFAAAYATQSVFAQIAVGLLGVVVAVITGMLGVYKLQENWLCIAAPPRPSSARSS